VGPDLRILLVDDSAADLLITGKLIERQRPPDVTVRITEAGRLDAACEALRLERYDCVLLDLHLPDGRGVDNVGALRRIVGNVPIVVLSGSNDPSQAERTRSAGADAYVSKRPLRSADNIFQVIADVIERPEATPPGDKPTVTGPAV